MSIIKNKPPLRIAILVRLFPNIVQTYVLNHIISLKRAGAETLIIAEKDPKQKEIHPAVQEGNLLKDTLYISTDSDGFVKQITSIPFTNRRYLAALRKIIFSDMWKRHGFKYGLKAIFCAKILSVHDFDLIHSHSLFCSYRYLFLKEYFSIPIITTFHGLVPKNVKMLDIEKIKNVLDAGDAFFVNTKFAKKQLTDFGCVQDKVHIIPQGTNTRDFPFRLRSISEEEPVVILSVGRLSIEKGFHIAIKAIARLKVRLRHIEYRIVGGGPEEPHLIELIQALDLQDSVKLCGCVNTDELQSHYSKAHIFILPSINLHDDTHTETQGVVLQEAQSSGIPVIASKTGGIPEVIQDGITGLLFDEGSDGLLATYIESLITDSNLYSSISKQARKDVENNFSVEVICKKQIAVYQKVLSDIINTT